MSAFKEMAFIIILFGVFLSGFSKPAPSLGNFEFRRWRAAPEDDSGRDVNNPTTEKPFDPSTCKLSSKQKAEIRGYQQTVSRIVEASTRGEFKGKTYDDLAYFVDRFGARLSGTDALEDSIGFLKRRMCRAGLQQVHGEEAIIPMWLRGNEEAAMISPRYLKLAVLGLGFSVSTPEEGITAPVVVINSLSEMDTKGDELVGKIVVFNSKSGEAEFQALHGPSKAAMKGAVAALIRSAASFSLYTVHAGVLLYQDKMPKIPAATLTVEDADLIERLWRRGENVTIQLKMPKTTHSERQSRNIIGDYRGRELPEEYVMVSGHVDSWDSGQGAVDDGVGPILALEVVRLLQHLDLQPRRTIRSVFFTGEEPNLAGSRRYVSDHKNEFGAYSAAMEADDGCLKATGLQVIGSTEATCILHEIMNLFAETNATLLSPVLKVNTDVKLVADEKVPGIVLDGDDGRYFWYHHTSADTMTALHSPALDNCLAVWASTAYVIADLHHKLPR